MNLVTLSSALLVASAGLYFSTVAKRPWIACLQTYGFFIFFWALIPLGVIAFVEIFNANCDALSYANMIRPGQVLKIPQV